MKLQQGNYVLLDGTKEVEVIWQKNEKVCIIKVGVFPFTLAHNLP